MQDSQIEVLVIEDDPAEADLIREMLEESRKQNFSVKHALCLADGLAMLRSRNFDVVLIDLGLPDSRGLETALAVRNAATHAPVVVLTTLDDLEVAITSLQMDIQDYLVKGETNSEMAVRAIRYAVERKRIAEKLRESEQRFASFMLHMPTAAWIKDLDGRYVYANAVAERIFSASLPELLGRTDDELFPPETARQFRENDNRVLAEGGHIQTTEVLRQTNGIEHHSIVSKFAVDGLDGKPAYVAGVALDITERKRAEDKIEELNTSLTERAAELALANEELEAFNYTVAHDLRKPLTVVNSYCQAIKEMCGNQFDAHCAEYLQEAYDGTLRMNRLIDALLKFSRLGHVELHLETVDLSDMARGVATELQLAEPGRRVEFRIADGVMADADTALMRVVLENLLGNAWKYTGSLDEGIIEFGTMEADGKPAYFVRDNGAGFDMADAERLFLPFQRLHGAQEFKGHGIGLATAERIIRRHGGKVWAQGEPDKGAIFYFTLH